jgi:hypothetical protein
VPQPVAKKSQTSLLRSSYPPCLSLTARHASAALAVAVEVRQPFCTCCALTARRVHPVCVCAMPSCTLHHRHPTLQSCCLTFRCMALHRLHHRPTRCASHLLLHNMVVHHPAVRSCCPHRCIIIHHRCTHQLHAVHQHRTQLRCITPASSGSTSSPLTCISTDSTSPHFTCMLSPATCLRGRVKMQSCRSIYHSHCCMQLTLPSPAALALCSLLLDRYV